MLWQYCCQLSLKYNAMKKIVITLVCLLSLVLVQCHYGGSESTVVSNGDNSVKTVETATMFTLEASLSDERASDIYEYINAAIRPDAQFDFEDDSIDTGTSLDDGTTLHIVADDGELKITFDKEANSHESYKRVKRMYEGVKKFVE